MNDKIRELGTDEVLPPEDDAAAGMVAALQDEVDSLQSQLAEAKARVVELENAPAPDPVVVPSGDATLRALATTYRTALRNGHPDAPKHLEALLAALGA